MTSLETSSQLTVVETEETPAAPEFNQDATPSTVRPFVYRAPRESNVPGTFDRRINGEIPGRRR